MSRDRCSDPVPRRRKLADHAGHGAALDPLSRRSQLRALREEELRARVYEAFELRETPYLFDAVEAIVDGHERAPLTLFKQRQEENARAIRLLRETNPDRLA